MSVMQKIPQFSRTDPFRRKFRLEFRQNLGGLSSEQSETRRRRSPRAVLSGPVPGLRGPGLVGGQLAGEVERAEGQEWSRLRPDLPDLHQEVAVLRGQAL